jgi:hypothetical protein
MVCTKELPDIQSQGLAMEGRERCCPSCGERYSYTILSDGLHLRRYSVPVGFEGPVEILVGPAIAKEIFIFETGEQVSDIKSLARVAAKGTKEAMKHLYNGDFQQWLSHIGEEECADFASMITRSKGNKNVAGVWLDPKVELVGFRLFVLFLSADPLSKAKLYMWFKTEDIEALDVNSKFWQDNCLLLYFAEKVSLEKLTKLIAEYEGNADQQWFSIKTGILSKERVYRRDDIERLLPKLKFLLLYKSGKTRIAFDELTTILAKK